MWRRSPKWQVSLSTWVMVTPSVLYRYHTVVLTPLSCWHTTLHGDTPHCHSDTPLSWLSWWHHTVMVTPHCHGYTTLSWWHTTRSWWHSTVSWWHHNVMVARHTVIMVIPHCQVDTPHCHVYTTFKCLYHIATATSYYQSHHIAMLTPHCHGNTTMSQLHHTDSYIGAPWVPHAAMV